MDRVIKDVATQFPNTVAVHSRTQANTFFFGDILFCLYNAIDLSLYEFCKKPNNNTLAWAGRISPENGLEDALKVSELTELKVRIFGAIQDEKYWDSIRASFQNKLFLEYVGFLMTSQFQQELRQCRAILGPVIS